ncbi:MAG: glycosyltransferase family 39 protein [Ignavibacteriales bacterium]|nr:glycosyltransferase family 39 protein [Ignavibacteriales bacterium]
MMEKLKNRDFQIIALLAGAKLLIHFLFNGGYGVFRDEFYYLACGEHLAFGYVDHPPLIALIAKSMRLILGDSLFAIRFLPAIAGALVVFFTGLLVRRMGGGRVPAIAACLAVIFSPVYLASGNFLSMNVFDQLFWTIAFYLIALILTEEKRLYWILLGIVIGVGFENKISILFLLFGVGIGLVLTDRRRLILRNDFWIAAIIALLISLPHILWQIAKGFPTLEFIDNAAQQKNIRLNPMQFLSGQLMDTAIVGLLLLILGILFFFFSKNGKPFRVFGWTYVAILLLFLATHAKTYYIAPLYPLMFAAGCIYAGELSARRWMRPLVSGVIAVIIFLGALGAPFCLPILSPESFLRYSAALGVTVQQSERHQPTPLPQHFADMFGWENMTLRVARVYYSLPDSVRTHCGIYVQNYGQAGALDFFGKSLGLPPVLCGHNNYWYWTEGLERYNSIIILGGDIEDYKKVFDQVLVVDVVTHPYVMPYENNLQIFICRGLRLPLKEIMKGTRHFI